MDSNATIYLPCNSVDLSAVFPGAKSNKSIFRAPSFFDVRLGVHTVRFNVMPSERVASHLVGFCAYIDSLPDEQSRKSDATMAVSQAKTVLGLVAPCSFEDNHEIWGSLFKVADAYDGYVFAYDSILLPSGAVIVGPLRADA